MVCMSMCERMGLPRLYVILMHYFAFLRVWEEGKWGACEEKTKQKKKKKKNPKETLIFFAAHIVLLLLNGWWAREGKLAEEYKIVFLFI